MATTTKTVPALTRTELLKGKPLTLELRDAEGNVVYKGYLPVREFSTSSIGYNANAKADLCIDGQHYVAVQIGANITVVGSKELPKA
jgi:hypothetical protein